MSKETKLMKNTAIIAIGNVCMKCISFFMFPLYTAVLTTSEYGTVDFITVIGSLLVSLVSLHIHEGLFRHLVECRDNSKMKTRYISTVTFFHFGISLISLLIATALNWLIDYKYVFFIAAHVLLLAFAYMVTHIARGFGDNVTYTIASCIGGSLRVILNVVFLTVFHMGIEGMLWAELIASISTITYPLIRLKLWNYISVRAFDRKCLKQLLNYSVPLVPYTLCWWVINAFSRVAISGILGTAANGIYSVASKFSSTFTLVADIFKTSWTESAAENVDAEERDGYYGNILDNAIRVYSAVNILILALMPAVFPILINDKFEMAYYYVPFLMISAFFNGISNLFGSVYTALKQTKKMAAITFWVAVVNLTVNALLIPKMELYGAAIASVAAYAMLMLIQYNGAGKMVGYRISRKFLATEAMIYAVVLWGYYQNDHLLRLATGTAAVIYAISSNRRMIGAMLAYAIKKLKKKTA